MEFLPAKLERFLPRLCTRRPFDPNISYRKLIIIVFFALAFLLYVGPYIFRLFASPKPRLKDSSSRCISDRLVSFRQAALNFDANIRHFPASFEASASSFTIHDDIVPPKNPFINFAGNGKIGVLIVDEGHLYLKNGRSLSLKVPYHPVVTMQVQDRPSKEATVLHYTTGLIHRFQCFDMGESSVDVQTVYYAHRTIPELFVQDIRITNPLDYDLYFSVDWKGPTDDHLQWATTTLTEDTEGSKKKTTSEPHPIITGQVPLPDNPGYFFSVAIIRSPLPTAIRVARQSVESVVVLTSVHFVGPVTQADYQDGLQEAIRQSKANFSRALKINSKRLREEHKRVWQQIWDSGFGISYSKASNALNGDKINATLYFLLSNTRAPLHEVDVAPARKQELAALLSKPDGCYDGHHTLQASTLWSTLDTVDDVINVVNLWKLTLDKQGCHAMLRTGVDGAFQAMLLSFGAMKFSKDHLEMCVHPKDLHREYDFRRLNYGNATRMNLSVSLDDDNKAIIYVSVDSTGSEDSKRTFFACDGGCLDGPVQITEKRTAFPVKLTDPPTAILYVTSDKRHLEELKHTIHVKEIVEAPAHEHHILALHRHGHHLGGLPMLFWVSIAFLVLVFHLFLFKLIYNEYCSATGNGLSSSSTSYHHLPQHPSGPYQYSNQQGKARARYAL